MGTTRSSCPWKVDLQRLRVYLHDLYQVDRAYYYLGYVQNDEVYQSLYEEIQTAGFVLVFREHNSAMLGTKKGNVDSDIIFSVMKRLYKKEDFDNVVLVSGDGDYKMLVDFLIEEKKLKKLLLPKQRYASSLYKVLGAEYFADLSNPDVRRKIEK